MSEYALALAPLARRRGVNERSDEELLEAIAAGEDEALGALYDRFRRVAYGVALRVLRDQALAEDAVVEAVVLGLVDPLALTADGQRAVVELDRDLVLRDARQVERVDELVLGLPGVDGRDPRARRVAVRLAQEGAHQPAHVVLQGSDLAERLPANQCRHRVIPPVRTYGLTTAT